VGGGRGAMSPLHKAIAYSRGEEFLHDGEVHEPPPMTGSPKSTLNKALTFSRVQAAANAAAVHATGGGSCGGGRGGGRGGSGGGGGRGVGGRGGGSRGGGGGGGGTAGTAHGVRQDLAANASASQEDMPRYAAYDSDDDDAFRTGTEARPWAGAYTRPLFNST